MKLAARKFKRGDIVRRVGDDAKGIVRRVTRERAYVDWIGFATPPGNDGWHLHSELQLR